jgi:NADPH:quinone reductase-like Zn-dependent oxidoreductase
MKAIVLRCFGGPEQLVLENVPDPEPAFGEIVIKVAAVSINRSFDLAVRKGAYSRGAVLPLVLGADPSGTVCAIGEGVTAFKLGERVAVMSTIACGQCHECRRGAAASCGSSRTIGVHRWGGYAEYVAMPAGNAALIPEALGFDAATAIARHGSAAYNFLIERGRLRAGETAVIFGASGALGAFAVQVAKSVGATVVAVAGADDRAAFARRLGADATINYRDGDPVEQVMALTGGRGADLVFESSGDPEIWPLALRCVAQAGRLVSCGAHGGGQVQLDLRRLYIGRLQIIGAAGVNLSDLDWALAAGARGDIKATIDRVYPLECASDAQDYVERARPLGKVLIAPGRDFASVQQDRRAP